MEHKITQLLVYPIKSLPGIALQEAQLSETGIAWDRYWMLTDQNGQFISQRNMPRLVFFKIQLKANGVKVDHPSQKASLFIPFERAATYTEIEVTLFDKPYAAAIEQAFVNQWFSKALGEPVYLTFIPSHQDRRVNRHPDAKINFPDSSQYLFIGEASMNHLNSKLESPIDVIRFRPNIVFTSKQAHIEDEWTSIRIAQNEFNTVKSCGRCQVTTIDPATGVKSKEPLKTLSTYRRSEKNVLFGRYFKCLDEERGLIKIGDTIQVL